MLYCPNCKQEYRDGIQECADCMVPLVDQETFEKVLREAAAGQDAVAAVFRAEDAETLDLMARAIAVHHIPYEIRSPEVREEGEKTDSGDPASGLSDAGNPDADNPGTPIEGHLLLVPMEMGQKVAHILDRGLSMLIAHGEDKDRVYRLFKQEREEEIRDPALLRQPTAKLVAQGDEIIDQLIEFVARGDMATKGRAAYVLTCLGDNGIQLL